MLKNKRSTRRLCLERFEARQLMAGDAGLSIASDFSAKDGNLAPAKDLSNHVDPNSMRAAATHSQDPPNQRAWPGRSRTTDPMHRFEVMPGPYRESLATDIYVSNKVLTIDASRNIDLNHIVVRIDHGRRETFRDDVIVVSQGSPAPSVVPVYSEDGQLSVTSLTYFGNDLADRLYNDTYLSSWVDLRGGDDYVRGGSGDDEVFGGLGDDTILGGAGDDVLDGGFGNDVISGQSGNDRIIGGNGDDSLSGGTGRDGLFGGQGADEIWGGPDADRFLRTKRFEDYRYETPRWWQLFKLPAYMPIDSINDASPADTSVYFEDGAATIVSLNGTPTQFREGRWTDDEILLVDQALDVLARRTNSNTLVRRPDGTELVFIRVGTQLSDASNNRFSGFNSGTITLSDGAFASPAWTQQTVFHEVGHYWDADDHIAAAFRRLSGWRIHVPLSVLTNNELTKYKPWVIDAAKPYGDVLSGNKRWYHDADALFARDYGKENPREDFATSWAAYFSDYGDAPYLGGPGARQIPDKIAFFDRLISSLVS